MAVIFGLASAGAVAAGAIPVGDTEVHAGFEANSDITGIPYGRGSRTIFGSADSASGWGFSGVVDPPVSYSVNASYTPKPSPGLTLAGSVSGVVYEGYTLFVSGWGSATTNFRVNCSPACTGSVIDINIKGSVSTSVSMTLAAGQGAPAQEAHAFAYTEIGTTAQLGASMPNYGSGLFLSNGYYVRGFSPAAGVDNGIDISTSVDALDTSANQLGIATGVQNLTGSFSASPAKTSFNILASVVAGDLNSISLYGEIGVLSTRLGDVAAISLVIDPVITIDPAYLLAHPQLQADVQVGDGVGNFATPVPEPQAWALMLAGLLLAGTRARRLRRA